MVIDRNISKYIVFSDDSLSYALSKISENKSRIVFVLSQNGKLEGILSDGDFRRWLLTQREVNLSLPASQALNRDYISASIKSSDDEIRRYFSDRIEFIPLLDRNQRLVAVASLKSNRIKVGHLEISDESPAFLIAEIGNNHNGDFNRAIKLVEEAANAGANCVKFQMRDLNSIYHLSPASSGSYDLGSEYTLDLIKRFQLSNEELFKIFDFCKSLNVIPLCTPWDLNSVDALNRYGVDAYKVASADLTNHELLHAICNLGKPIFCSTGMSSESEILDTLRLLRERGSQFIALHCNSTYPAPFKDINLNYIATLKRLGDGCLVGYSGHERGFAVPIAAVAMGVKVIEKHFTLDRNLEGNDHRISLLPHEFQEMTRSIREVESALGSDSVRTLSQGEVLNREILGKSLTASRDISVGEIISADHIAVRSPGTGVAPYRIGELIGIRSTRNISAGECFFSTDIHGGRISPRSYFFDRPFGIPVRYHDFQLLAHQSNLNLVEIHFSYRDLDLDPALYLDPIGFSLDLVVHSPELFSGDHIMDLCSSDSTYRSRSISELQRVIDTARRLKEFFPKSASPFVIINAGGFSQDGFVSLPTREKMYERLFEVMQRIDSNGVEILPQTMPPFPWHFGGQRFHNLFKDAADIVRFCKQTNQRICLDVSHSKLACNHNGASFSEFIELVGCYVAHVHIADASGVDGEGLQIGQGEIDFRLLGRQLRQFCPHASFIPEIWQGHKNSGLGFWEALEMLESRFSSQS